MNLKIGQQLYYFDEASIKIIIGEIVNCKNNMEFAIKWEDKNKPIEFNILPSWIYTDKESLIQYYKMNENNKLQEYLANCRQCRKILEYFNNVEEELENEQN